MADDQVLGGGALAIIGAPATTTYGNTVSPTHALWLQPAPSVPQGAILRDLEDVATGGREYGRGVRRIGYDTPLRISGDLDENIAAILNGLAFGTDAVSSLGSGAYQHLAAKVAQDVQLASTTMEIYHSLYTSLVGAFDYDGWMINNLEMRWSDNGQWMFTADGPTTGFATQVSVPTTPTYTPGSAFCWPGAGTQVVLSTSTPSGVTADPGTGLATVANMGGGSGSGWTNVDLTGATKSGVIRVQNNLQPHRAGSNTGQVSKVRRGRQRVTVDLNLTHNPSVSAIYNFLNEHGAGTLFGLIIRKVTTVRIASSSYNYGLEYIFPQVSLISRPTITGDVARERDLGLSFKVFDAISSLQPVYPHVWNGQNIDYV